MQSNFLKTVDEIWVKRKMSVDIQELVQLKIELEKLINNNLNQDKIEIIFAENILAGLSEKINCIKAEKIEKIQKEIDAYNEKTLELLTEIEKRKKEIEIIKNIDEPVNLVITQVGVPDRTKITMAINEKVESVSDVKNQKKSSTMWQKFKIWFFDIKE